MSEVSNSEMLDAVCMRLNMLLVSNGDFMQVLMKTFILCKDSPVLETFAVGDNSFSNVIGLLNSLFSFVSDGKSYRLYPVYKDANIVSFFVRIDHVGV